MTMHDTLQNERCLFLNLGVHRVIMGPAFTQQSIEEGQQKCWRQSAVRRAFLRVSHAETIWLFFEPRDL